MTHTAWEVGRITCDDCGDYTESRFDPEFETTQAEQQWFRMLKSQGWVFKGGQHFCLGCMSEEMGLKPEPVQTDEGKP